MTRNRDLLFEIGTEEIPARFLPDIMDALAGRIAGAFSEQRISHCEIRALGTPRRLALLVSDIAPVQEERTRRVRGPAEKAAFDAEGKPSKAAVGFARSQGLPVDELEIAEHNGLRYVFATVCEDRRAVEEVLPGILTTLTGDLPFPKRMRWGANPFSFVRPIRWLVAMLGAEVLPLEIAGIQAANRTWGHRDLAPQPLALSDVSRYLDVLEGAGVLADPIRRRQVIQTQIQAAARQEGGVLDRDDALLEEVNWLVEWPSAFAGRFDPGYLDLPAEAIVALMKDKQKYFPVRSESGSLLSCFVGVRNGSQEGMDAVIRGNERVLTARLEDARFFYDTDRAVPFAAMGEKLSGIVYQEKLGTYRQKTERIVRIAAYLTEALGWGSRSAEIQECAKGCKNDLCSHMVVEYPELQGIMGGYYAQHAGLSPETARGIREHYLPRFVGDALPVSAPGTVVALADKVDALTGIIGVGLVPTGSQDPYALRRAAQGITAMVIARELPLDLQELVAFSCGLHGERVGPDTAGTVNDFLRARMVRHLQNSTVPHDIVEAVMAPRSMVFYDVFLRALALQEFSAEPAYGALVEGMTRALNIREKSPGAPFDPALMAEEEEYALARALDRVEGRVAHHVAGRRYRDLFQELVALKEPIDGFLDRILVMVDDEALCANRLALLDRVAGMVLPVADVRKINAK